MKLKYLYKDTTIQVSIYLYLIKITLEEMDKNVLYIQTSNWEHFSNQNFLYNTISSTSLGHFF